MRIFFLVQSEFFVQRSTKNFLIDSHYKIFTNKSELVNLPSLYISVAGQAPPTCIGIRTPNAAVRCSAVRD